MVLHNTHKSQVISGANSVKNRLRREREHKRICVLAVMHAAVSGGALVQQAERASSARDSFFAVRAYFVERSFKYFFELKHKCGANSAYVQCNRDTICTVGHTSTFLSLRSPMAVAISLMYLQRA